MSASPTTRRIVAALMAAGTLVGAAALPASADDHRRDQRDRSHASVSISDVQFGNDRGNDRSHRALDSEWVEINNPGRRSVNLSGYTLTDREGNRYRFHDFRLEGRSSVKIHTGQGRDTHRDLYQGRRHQIWDERDTATLRDNRGDVVDTESWGSRGHRHGH